MKNTGVVTLTLLILLTSSLLIIIILNNDILHLYSTTISQRKIYLEQSLKLQKISNIEKEKYCHNLNINTDKNTYQIKFNNDNTLSHYIWCRKESLFYHPPKKAINKNSFNYYINKEAISKFKHKFIEMNSNLLKKNQDSLYWFNENQNEWEIKGNINAVIIAEGDLTITGKGKISGTVITQGKLITADSVKIVYKKSTVNNIVRIYSYWQYAEKSWHDFEPL